MERISIDSVVRKNIAKLHRVGSICTEDDCVEIDRVLKELASHESYLNYRNILMMRIYMHTKMSLSKLVNLKRIHFPNNNISQVKIPNHRVPLLFSIPVELLQDDIGNFFSLREKSIWLFHSMTNLREPTAPESFLKFMHEILAQCGINYTREDIGFDGSTDYFLKNPTKLFPEHIPLGIPSTHNKVREDIAKETALAFERPYARPLSEFKYVCSSCGDEGACKARGEAESLGIMLNRGRKCVVCINNYHKSMSRDRIRAEKARRAKVGEEVYSASDTAKKSKKGQIVHSRTYETKTLDSKKEPLVNSRILGGIFEEELKRELSVFVVSEVGESLGFSEKDIDELFFLTLQERMGNTKLSPMECIKIVIEG